MEAEAAVLRPPPSARRPGTVVAGLTARRVLRSAVPWGYVFGLYVATSALGYAGTYKTVAARRALAATFGSNPGITALLGPALSIDTVSGFTAWRSLGVLTVVGAVWGLLTATRLLRGEEEAGRWELLLAGQTTRRRAAGQALGGMAVGLLVLWLVAAVITAAVGRLHSVHYTVAAGLYLAVALVCGAGLFMAVGALTSQLAATRRRAAAWAAVVLGAAYALRMAADSGTGLAWLRWASPLGWIEELHPLSSPRPWVLAPLGVLTVGLAVAAVVLAGVRDLGASIVPDRPTARARTALLGGPTGLTVRLVRAVVIGWWVAVSLGGLLTGSMAKSAGQALEESSSYRQIIARLGGHGVGARAYLGVVFLIMATLVALVAAGQLSAARSEEAEGRLDHLVVRPLSRSSWLAGRLGVALVAVVVAGLLGSLATWVGAATQDSGVGLWSMVQAGLNVVPPAVLVLGLGTATFGLWPRGTSLVAYGLIAWAFLVSLVGGVVNLNHWLLDTSIFHQMASAPAVPPDWTSGGVMAAVGVAGALVGAWALNRRDLAGE